MKIFVNIVLFLFISFLAAPTVVSLIKDDADMSMVYSLTEEELQKEVKEVKAASTEYGVRLVAFTASKKSSLIKSANRCKHDTVAGDICSPPPEVI